jgi:monothiol glutaredoxin
MDVRSRIESLLRQEPVVLFMKGHRGAPACGFSARVVDLLDEHLEDYLTVDVLADEALREGIKDFGQWPTLPQLYVRGTLVGGADILAEMARTGELAGALGVSGPLSTETPEVHITEAAVTALRGYAGVERPQVRMVVDRAFDTELDLAGPEKGDLVLDLGALTLAMDRATARRAHGITIDFVEGVEASGFRIENPMAPPKVKSLSVAQLDRMRKGGKPHLLLDVRTKGERAIAHIEGSELLDEAFRARLTELDRATTLVLYCHHGVRSRSAAEHCLRLGFSDVWNVEGGIDEWSQRVDPDVERY